MVKAPKGLKFMNDAELLNVCHVVYEPEQSDDSVVLRQLLVIEREEKQRWIECSNAKEVALRECADEIARLSGLLSRTQVALFFVVSVALLIIGGFVFGWRS